MVGRKGVSMNWMDEITMILHRDKEAVYAVAIIWGICLFFTFFYLCIAPCVGNYLAERNHRKWKEKNGL